MAELFEQVVSVLEGRSSTRSLASQYRIPSEQAAGNAAVLAVPVFMAELAKRTNDPSQSIGVLKILRNINTVGLQNLGVTIESRLYEPIGSELTELLLGDQRTQIAAVVSAEAGVSQRSASSLLPPTAWTVAAHIAECHGNRIDRQSLSTILNRECESLVEAGWGPWLQATAALSSGAGSSGGQAADPAPGTAGPAARGGGAASEEEVFDRAWGALAQDTAGEASRDLVRSGTGVVAGSGTSTAVAEVAALADSGQSSATARGSSGRDARRSFGGRGTRRRSAWRVVWMVFGAAAFLGAVAASVYWLVPRDGPDLGPAADESATVVGATAAEDVDQEQAADGDVVVFPDLDILPVDVNLADPTGQSSATGLAELRFDRPAEKVCYSIEADETVQPLDGHLRAGGPGADGEILVTLGRFTSPAIGCVDMPSDQMETVLSAPADHYVDLVDPATGTVIRAQLSENTADQTG